MSTALAAFSPKQIDLIRRTVAADCNPPEFDQFMHICRHVNLDPLRRQVYAFVFQKSNPEKRRMSIVTAIDGYRTIAARTQSYRPDNRAPRIEYDPALKNPDTNPLGIVRAEVSVFKFSHGEWHEVVGEAYWDEYAPIKEIWENSKPTGRFALDKSKDNWRKMARVMIAKCAEAQALRRAWPDDFSALEVQEEVDKRILDLTASEIADEAAAEAKLALVGGKDAVTIQFEMNGPLARVPLGEVADKVFAWAETKDRTATELQIFWNQNLPARMEYKAKRPSEYLDFQRAFERKQAELAKADQQVA